MLWKLIGIFVSCALLGACGTLPARAAGDGHERHESAQKALDTGGVELTLYTSEPVRGDEAVLFVGGMACPMCATNVDLKLQELPGVTGSKVNLELGSVLVTMGGAERPSSEQLAKAVDDSGFTLTKIVVR